ncbi:MazG nucleotide pyrophosphohydrolase domain-containing protein [Janibacter corallicola]|uniref:MazG nucleotide pyrophosphohydrolase domain-containing protein n=1 Tax=Janibacter corallicola TaxID=415212 RepID=UPI0008339A84|nr:MazG nucleotide pyrophosphohydrolase domain-containing protein [Janibacter corallicola]
MSAGRLVLLATSPRVPPGLLSRDAWSALAGADVVLAADPEDSQVIALLDDGIAVQPLDVDTPQERARALVTAAAGEEIVWVGSVDGDPGLSDAVAGEVSRLEDAPEVEVLVGSWDTPGGRLLDAVAVMDRLRAPGGCAWVAAQDHASLAPFVAEEAREVTEALEAVVAEPDDVDRREDLTDELGDLLFQVLFHARVAADHAEAPFDVDDVAAALVDKLVRRNPHVFGDVQAETLEEIEAQWQEIKAQERADRDQR